MKNAIFTVYLTGQEPRAKSKETGIKVPRAAHHRVGKQEWNDDGWARTLSVFASFRLQRPVELWDRSFALHVQGA